MEPEIQDKNVCGLWRLVAWELITMKGGREFPFGQRPHGYVMYHPSGFLSMHVGAIDREHVKAPTNFDVQPKEAGMLVSTYYSYCGRFEVKNNLIYHFIELCIFSNWEGTVFNRSYEIIDDHLEMSQILETDNGLKTFLMRFKRVPLKEN